MSGRDGREVLPDLLPRIRAAAQESKDALDAAMLRLRHRDELIVEAVDEGIPQRVVAEAAGLSKGRIIAILGNATVEDVV